MRVLGRRGAAFFVCVLVAASCSASNGAQVAVGPVPTTPPLAIPPVLRQPDTANQTSQEPLATTSPVTAPTAVAEQPPASAGPATTAIVTATATAAPATVVPATVVPATVVPATVVPTSPSATAVPTNPATSAAAAGTTGATVVLGDFQVENLVTKTTQNIAELSPSGPTMLWFWAPH